MPLFPNACNGFVDENGNMHTPTCNPLLDCRRPGVVNLQVFAPELLPTERLVGRYRGYRQAYLMPITDSKGNPRAYCYLDGRCKLCLCVCFLTNSYFFTNQTINKLKQSLNVLPIHTAEHQQSLFTSLLLAIRCHRCRATLILRRKF